MSPSGCAAGTSRGMKPGQGKSSIGALDLLLLRNAARVRGLDSAITYLSPFLPGQSPSAALGSEAAASVTMLLNVYMDQVIARLSTEGDKGLDSKFLDAMYNRNRNYRLMAYILSILKSSELFMEMTGQHFKGRRGQWRVVLGLESAKAALRLGMLAVSQRSLPSNVPVHEPGLDQAETVDLLSRLESPSVVSSRSGKVVPDIFYEEARSRLKRPDLDLLRPAADLVHRLNPQRAFAEVLHILRPLIYALVLYRYRTKRRNWTPWLIGLAVELIARQIARNDLQKNRALKPTGLEKQLRSERDKDLLWWVMRGAMYENWSRPALARIAQSLMGLPVVKVAGILLEDWMFLFDEYYFGAATM